MNGRVTTGTARQRLDALIRSNRVIPLGSYLRRLAQVSVTSSMLAGAGCADGAFVDPSTVNTPLCEDGGWRPTQGLAPARGYQDYDYLQVTACESSGFCFVIDSDGNPCATASDPDACQALVEGDPESPVGGLLTTLGDAVEHFETKDELMRFLGTVDTEQEALLVASFDDKLVRCGDPTTGGSRPVADGYEVIITGITADCEPIEYTRYLLHVARDGTVTELKSEVFEIEPGCVGRRPQGLLAAPKDERAGTLGSHFAGIARLEAAAVIAFHRLAAELEALGAPDSLVEEARRAADDEVRHAAIMGDLARHFGGQPAEPQTEAPEDRTAYTIALENAVEGCVRETFGALLGSYQALCATDPAVARAMSSVADDEVRHADLSVRVSAFLYTLLGPGERASIAMARRRAIAELRLEMSVNKDAVTARRMGLPQSELALAWLDRLEQDLWTN